MLEPLSGYLRLGQLLAEHPELSGEAFNFGPEASQNRTVLDLLEALAGYSHFAVYPFGEGAKKFIVEKELGFKETALLKLNCDKALDLLGWQPMLQFEEAAAQTGEWYRHFYSKTKENMAELTLQQLHLFTKTATERGANWTL